MRLSVSKRQKERVRKRLRETCHYRFEIGIQYSQKKENNTKFRIIMKWSENGRDGGQERENTTNLQPGAYFCVCVCVKEHIYKKKKLCLRCV